VLSADCERRNHILLAEDQEDDILLIQRAFKQGGIRYPLMVVRDGEEAINIYPATAATPIANYIRSRFVSSGLTLPITDGFESCVGSGAGPG